MIPREAVWMPMRSLHLRGIAAPMADWLADSGSLTRRLLCHCAEQQTEPFQVRVVRQCWAKPLASERQLLAMPRSSFALIREVELCCDQQPMVFARTVIPLTSLRGAVRQLALLGSRPLGEVLFRHPSTKREQFQLTQLRPPHALYQSAIQSLANQPAMLYGRRTCFRFLHQPLLVNEIFLPSLFEQEPQ